MPTQRYFLFLIVLLIGCKQSVQEPAPKVIISDSSSESERVVFSQAASSKLRQLLTELAKDGSIRVSIADNRLKLDIDTVVDKDNDFYGSVNSIPYVIDKENASMLPVGLYVDYYEDSDTKGFLFRSPGFGNNEVDLTVTLAEARQGFVTKRRKQVAELESRPVAIPPSGIFRMVQYKASSGDLQAYLTPDPKDGKKHPAIVWITGGDCNTIDAGCWRDGPAIVDQSASAYRKKRCDHDVSFT